MADERFWPRFFRYIGLRFLAVFFSLIILYVLIGTVVGTMLEIRPAAHRFQLLFDIPAVGHRDFATPVFGRLSATTPSPMLREWAAQLELSALWTFGVRFRSPTAEEEHRLTAAFQRLIRIADPLPWDLTPAFWVTRELYPPRMGTLANGILIISPHLFDALTDEELAAIVAHELSHLTAHHNERHRWRAPIAPMLEEIAAWQGDIEIEADLLGMQYLWKAGYNPSAYRVMFEKIAPHDDELGRFGYLYREITLTRRLQYIKIMEQILQKEQRPG